MELRHLRYFVTVAEEENVTRAAARLHVSQPPLTRQIRDLESELGVALFQRTGKSLRLTEPGRFFLGEARSALQRVEEAVQALRNFASGGQGEVHVGYAPSPSVGILPLILREFRRRTPRVRIVLHDHASPEMLAGLRNGSLHAAFMMEPPARLVRDLVFEKLRAFPLVVAIAPDHPFARRRSVTLKEVLAEPIVAYSRKEFPDYHGLLNRATGGATKRLRLVEECDSGTSLIAAIESGRGIAITSTSLADSSGRRLRFVDLSPPLAGAATLGIACRRDRLSPLIRSLLEIAVSTARAKDSGAAATRRTRSLNL